MPWTFVFKGGPSFLSFQSLRTTFNYWKGILVSVRERNVTAASWQPPCLPKFINPEWPGREEGTAGGGKPPPAWARPALLQGRYPGFNTAQGHMHFLLSVQSRAGSIWMPAKCSKEDIFFLQAGLCSQNIFLQATYDRQCVLIPMDWGAGSAHLWGSLHCSVLSGSSPCRPYKNLLLKAWLTDAASTSLWSFEKSRIPGPTPDPLNGICIFTRFSDFQMIHMCMHMWKAKLWDIPAQSWQH